MKKRRELQKMTDAQCHKVVLRAAQLLGRYLPSDSLFVIVLGDKEAFRGTSSNLDLQKVPCALRIAAEVLDDKLDRDAAPFN